MFTVSGRHADHARRCRRHSRFRPARPVEAACLFACSIFRDSVNRRGEAISGLFQ